jgi:hypothetical protein
MPVSTHSIAENLAERSPAVSDRRIVDGDSRYSVGGKTFLVERVFREDSRETVGTVLLRLLRMEADA